MMFKEHCLQFLIAADQLVNTIFGGYADETLSSRCYRENRKVAQFFINCLFFNFNHCKEAYESEKLKNHFPFDLR